MDQQPSTPAPAPQDGRLLDVGQTFTLAGNELEVCTVSAQEQDGRLVNFRYELALKSEMEELRAKNEAAKNAEALKNQSAVAPVIGQGEIAPPEQAA